MQIRGFVNHNLKLAKKAKSIQIGPMTRLYNTIMLHTNWGEPELASHKRYMCAQIVYIIIVHRHLQATLYYITQQLQCIPEVNNVVWKSHEETRVRLSHFESIH